MSTADDDVLRPEQRVQAQRLCAEWGLVVDAGLLEGMPVGLASESGLRDLSAFIAEQAPIIARMPEEQAVLVLQYLQERATEYHLAQMVARGVVECDVEEGEPRFRLAEEEREEGA